MRYVVVDNDFGLYIKDLNEPMKNIYNIHELCRILNELEETNLELSCFKEKVYELFNDGGVLK